MTLSIFNTEIFHHFGRMFSRILSKERWMGILSKERWMGILSKGKVRDVWRLDTQDVFVRRNAGRNPDTPLEDLIHLSQDDDSMVRWWVACNPSTPPDTLLSLSMDSNWSVRSQVLQDISTPYGTWVQDGFGLVRVF